MRILLAPDRFGERLDADQVARALQRGWSATAPDDEVGRLPLSDGGPGFLDVVHGALGGESFAVTVPDPRGRPVPARVLVTGGTAYVEAAESVGRHLVPPPERDPLAFSTAGVGDLLAAALDTGCGHVVVGVGGTATVDGGQGMVAALGGLTRARARLSGATLTVATATDAPLLGHSGAAHGFGAAKGADRAARDRLEARLRAWATETDGALATRPGAGAGGGLGFALLLLGARRVNGTELVADAVALVDRVRQADVAVTAVPVLDWELLRGRVPVAVARAAQQVGRPTVVLAERVDVGRRELAAVGIDAAYDLASVPGGEADHPLADRLAALAARVARTWSRRP